MIPAMKRIALAIQSHVELTDVLFFGGLILLGYGLSQLQDGLGYALVGLLLVLYVRPLKGWWVK